MRKKISIVVPSYTESAGQIAPLLYSIASQSGNLSEIEVIIVRDGTEKLDFSQFDALPFALRQIALPENAGTGNARQAGIDAADSEYILCCDADDVLHDVLALGVLYGTARENDSDIVISKWLEESKDGNGFRYIVHHDDSSWMHGKLLRKSFIERYGIRFHPDLRWNEESYFLGLYLAHASKVTRIGNITYVWKWDENSITRRNNGEYSFTCAESFVTATTLSSAEIEKFNPGILPYKITQTIMYMYFNTHLPEWLTEEHREHREAAERAVQTRYKPFMRYFNINDAATYNQERERTFKGCVESETLSDWLDRLKMFD